MDFAENDIFLFLPKIKSRWQGEACQLLKSLSEWKLRCARGERAPLSGTSVDFPPRGIVPSVGWKSQFPKNNSVDHGPGSNTYESSNQLPAENRVWTKWNYYGRKREWISVTVVARTVKGLKWNKLWQVWKLRRAEISFSRLSIVVVSPVCFYQIYSKMYEFCERWQNCKHSRKRLTR